MSIIATDVQKLDSGNSPYIELFEIQVNDTDYIYLTNYIKGIGEYADDYEGEGGAEESKTLLQFRDYDVPTIIRHYYPIPVALDGVEFKSEGQFPQPVLTIANILRTDSGNNSLQALLGTVSYDELLGLKVIRRRTLKKYLFGESGDNNPPIELPRDVYYLDRIENETAQSVEFTTVLPVDFTGVTIPRRNILANRCPWAYQGAAVDKNPWERDGGGCSWRTDSRLLVGDHEYNIYVSADDEYIVDASLITTTWSAGTYNNLDFVRTAQSLTKISSTGTLSTVSGYNYWQCIDTGTGTTATPSDSSGAWRRVRVFSTFNASNEINVYVEDKYSDYVKSGSIVWKAVGRGQVATVATPAFGSLWERGDKCGKTLNSCRLRYQAAPMLTLAVASSTDFVKHNEIIGITSDSKATIVKVTGNTLYLTNATGNFTSGETIENNDHETASTTASGDSSSIGATPSRLNKKVTIPFGSFPTARSFQ